MVQSTKIICPHCENEQEDDLFEYLEADAMEGEFNLNCDKCEEEFTVVFELRPYIETK